MAGIYWRVQFSGQPDHVVKAEDVEYAWAVYCRELRVPPAVRSQATIVAATIEEFRNAQEDLFGERVAKLKTPGD